LADLSEFWRNRRAVFLAEFDQKKMLASEMILELTGNEIEPDRDGEKLVGIINHFATSDKIAISIMGVLAQVGLAAMAADDFADIQD
jgi:hypothetical protein